jgi:hypothetical protein
MSRDAPGRQQRTWTPTRILGCLVIAGLGYACYTVANIASRHGKAGVEVAAVVLWLVISFVAGAYGILPFSRARRR